MADKTTITVGRGWTIGKRIFLSGPMTGYEDYNQKGFVAAQIRLKLLGAEHVYNPILQWICEPQHISITRTHESYMLECLNELTRYHPDGTPFYDAVVQLDRWEDSEGARMEAEAAQACGIPLVSFAQLDEAEGEDVTVTDDLVDEVDTVTGDAPDAGTSGLTTLSKPLSFDWAKLWDEWDDVRISWESVGPDGTNTHNEDVILSDLHPVSIAALFVIQQALEDRGIEGKNVVGMRVIEIDSCGMNAFVNIIQCDLEMTDGSPLYISFDLSGPVIFDKGATMDDQVEIDSLRVRSTKG